jgi:hypothetical protein
MEPGILDITIIKGTDFISPYVQLCDDNGDAIDITGYTASLIARATPESTAKIINLTTENSGLVLTEATGIITPYLAKASVDLLTAGVYDYALFVKDTDDNIQCWIIGKITVSKTAGEL